MANDTTSFNMGSLESFEGIPVDLYVQSALADYKGLAQTAHLKHHLSQAIDQMVLQLTAWCASGRIPSRSDSKTVAWPDGPWQAFKQKYMPHWFTQRFPVREVTRTFEVTTYHYFVCPHIDVPVDCRDRLIHIKFMATGSPLAERIHTNHADF